MRDTVQEEGFSPPDFVVDTATPADESSELEPTVFVVDDDLKTRELLCLLMASAGIHAEAYPSAQAFLDAYDPSRPGCVLLDFSMPGMNGIELQEQLASLEPAPVIIFLTGYGNIPRALQAVRSGAIDFIEKPFATQELIARVQEAIALDGENRVAYRKLQDLKSRQAALTMREREVMDLLDSGQSTKAIASRLGISPKTVDKHRSKVLTKMGVDSLIELTHLLLGRVTH